MRRSKGVAAAVVTAAALAGAVSAPALAGTAPATVSATPVHAVTAVMKLVGAAGYLATLTKSATSITAKTVLTVPKTTCGSGFYSPAVSALYKSGLSTLGATVELGLGCFGPAKAYGDATITIGSATRTVAHPLKAGATVTITVTVSKSAAAVTIAYSKKSSVTLKGAGGEPTSVLVGSILPDGAPKYSPIKFASTTVDGKGKTFFINY